MFAFCHKVDSLNLCVSGADIMEGHCSDEALGFIAKQLYYAKIDEQLPVVGGCAVVEWFIAARCDWCTQILGYSYIINVMTSTYACSGF
jgi:hypothetical protein